MDKSKLLTVPSAPSTSTHCEPADLRSLKLWERYDSKINRYVQADEYREAQFDYEHDQGPGWNNTPETDGDISDLRPNPTSALPSGYKRNWLRPAAAQGARNSSPWHKACDGRAIKNTDTLHPAASQRHDTIYSMHHGDNAPIMGLNERQYKPVNLSAKRYETGFKPVIASKMRDDQHKPTPCAGGVCQTTWKPRKAV